MFDPGISAAGLVVGFMVGLTGMGGGALMTPLLILLFDVKALVAVGSDLVASLFMKPVGGAVHLRSGTVNREIVRWLVTGSVPAAFAGVLILQAFGDDRSTELLKPLLGVMLLVAAIAMVAKGRLMRRRSPAGSGGAVTPRPPLTLAVGVVGGLVVGLTSVGSGSLVIVMLLVAYPGLRAAELVGTDLVQAVPLVASAALGHLLFGEVELGITGSVLVGALPGVYVGAQLSARAPDRLLQPTLCIVLFTTGLRLVRVI